MVNELLEQLNHFMDENPGLSTAVIATSALAVSTACAKLYDWYYAPQERQVFHKVPHQFAADKYSRGHTPK